MSSLESRIAIVLHRSIYPRNVGMCARAMANMGLSHLILVEGVELNDEAKQGAAHAQDILRNSKSYKTIDDFFAAEGEGVRIALSGKDARIKVPEDLSATLQKALGDSEHRLRSKESIYLFFGAEDDGLTPEVMERCHYVCRLPTYSEVSSLNLSHAVLLTSYIVRQELERHGVSAERTVGSSTNEPLDYPHDVIHRWLDALGLDLSSPRINIEKTLNRILLSRCPTPEELRIVEKVLHQTVRMLKDKKSAPRE
ncbi:MAG TPA: RNA methyltransferase [Bdellovibrionales bacterium]|nr:RNA methyltransferase [Bdellovibrionales bacterium]